MKAVVFGVVLAVWAGSAQAEITSAYTEFNAEKDCAVFSETEPEGDFSSMVCPGYKGYPILLYSADLRESVYFGFPTAETPAWESFGPFNGIGGKTEWRIETGADGRSVPFAAIQRFFVSDPQDSEKKVEVLVVEKVGQVEDQEGCAVGLVLATGNPNANAMARTIADEAARDFACGADERTIVGSPMPEFSRGE